MALLSTGPVDPEEFAKAQASNPILQRIGRSVAGVSGVWPSMLPRLRERAQLNREEIAGQLADALGNPQGAEKISDYYHRMEWGDLPASGVNDRVIDALAQILDSDANQLRESGMSGDSGTGESSDDPEIVEARVQAFARFAATDIEQTASNDNGPHDNLASWDETDRLFLGG